VLALKGPRGVSRAVSAPRGEERERIDEILGTVRLTAQAHDLAPPQPRPEAVAGDRHAAGAGPEAAAGRRAGRRHDRRRDRRDRPKLLKEIAKTHSVVVVEHDMQLRARARRQGHGACTRARCWPKARSTSCQRRPARHRSLSGAMSMLSPSTQGRIDLYYGAAQALRGVSLDAERPGRSPACSAATASARPALLRAIGKITCVRPASASARRRAMTVAARSFDGKDALGAAPYERARAASASCRRAARSSRC
jgi:hypothetical protein